MSEHGHPLRWFDETVRVTLDRLPADDRCHALMRPGDTMDDFFRVVLAVHVAEGVEQVWDQIYRFDEWTVLEAMHDQLESLLVAEYDAVARCSIPHGHLTLVWDATRMEAPD